MRRSNTIHERDIVLWVNISLAGIVLLLFFYYIMVANTVASKNYKIQTLRNKAEALADINGLLVSQKLVLEAPAELLKFAQSKSLVMAKNISYIFENKNVALKK